MESGRADGRRFAAKLRRLRDLNGKMTQEELHYASGVPLDLIQNYEQEKSLAKGDAAERLAKALHVSPAAFYAVEMDNMKELDEAAQVRLAAQLIFQLADAYCLEPIIDGDAVGITSSSGYMEYALAEWARRREADTSDTERAYSASSKEPGQYREIMDQMVETFSELQMLMLGFLDMTEKADFRNRPATLGETLQRLRRSAGMTQGALADAANISVFTVRAYEQGKRMPNDEQRLAMAKAFGVPKEVLTGYDIRNANEGFNYLLELHHIFGGWASMIGDKPAWQLSDMRGHRKLDKFVNDWNFAWVELKSTGDKDAYQDWKDHYEG